MCSAYDVIIHNKLQHISQLPSVSRTLQCMFVTLVVLFCLQIVRCRRFVHRHFALSATALLIAYLRWQVMGFEAPTFQEVDNPHSFVENVVLRVRNGLIFKTEKQDYFRKCFFLLQTLNYGYIYAINVLLCLCPVWLCFDWSMGCIPVISSFTDPRVAVSLLFWILSSAFLFALLSRRLDRTFRF